MPVAHLGLTVSHIPSATSFYLAALQPLGYHYIGQKGDAIGLGITDADLFLRPTKDGSRVSPTHIAFAAENRLVVRDCYTAALNAGAHPSGRPEYRNSDCSCFNAAVEDPDGNTIEFIFQEPSRPSGREPNASPSEYSVVSRQPPTVVPSGGRSYSGPVETFASKAQSTAKAAINLAASASRAMETAPAPNPGINRSNTEPLRSTDKPAGNAIVGTLLGAAAGAAFAYAMGRSERDNAANEEKVSASMRSKTNRSRSIDGRRTDTKNKTESRSSKRDSGQTARAIEAPRSGNTEAGEVIGQCRSMARHALQRSRTYDESQRRPRANSDGRTERSSIRRAATLPLGMEEFNDSAIDVRSHQSRRSSFSKASTLKNSKRDSQHVSAANVRLHPSRSTSYDANKERRARDSKTQPYTSAAKVPLPQSKATSFFSAAQSRHQNAAGYADAAEDFDGIGDLESLGPDDSISCVDFSRKSKQSSSKSSSRRSEANSERTIRPTKTPGSRQSARMLPMRRPSERGRRSAATYA